MTDDELDKLEGAYLLKFSDGPRYPRDGLTNEEKADLLRKALETGKKITLPPPEPGTLEYIELEYMARFGPLPRSQIEFNVSDEEYRAMLEKALAEGKPVDEMKYLMKNLPPGAVI